MKKKMTFALAFCNRGFMPGELIYGAREDMIKAFPMTMSNCQTKDGKIVVYASEAQFTEDPIEEGFFGCGGVAEIPDM